MAGGKSDALENALLDHAVGGPDYSRPATVYVALFTAPPTDAGGGTELSGNGYARGAVTNNATNWPAAAGGAKSNGTAITFAAATADWTASVAWGLFDAASGGNLLYWGPLSASVNVPNGAQAEFAAGALVIQES